MVERYHLAVAVVALLAGLVIAVADTWAPRVVRRHAVGVVGLAAAVLGGWGNARWWLWLAAAVLLAVWPDRGAPQHPLGPWVLAACVMSLAGIWSAVPDTEPPLAAAAALAPLAAIRGAARRACGPPATAALVGLCIGAVWVGSAGWGTALCALVAVGMVAAAPVAVGFGADRFQGRWLTAVWGAHVVVALAVPRLVMRRPVPVALTVAAAVAVALVLLARIAGRRGGSNGASA